MAEPTRNWLYEERQAFIVLRKAIQKKPWMVGADIDAAIDAAMEAMK